jgi:hypothetical protein
VPVENREIILSQEELLLAVGSYTRTHPTEYPPGRVVAADCRSTSEGVVVDAQINPPNSGDQVIKSQLVGDAVIEMLVRFSAEHNIPIPRAGRKSVRMADSGLVLAITLEGAQIN